MITDEEESVSVPRVDRSDIGVLLIDVQPFFMDRAFEGDDKGREALEVRLEHLLMIADWMELPLVTTFETPVEDNGELPERLEKLYPAGRPRHVKNYFGCMTEPEILTDVEAMRVRQIAVAGAETDVCILQSTLGLLERGYEVFLLEDCLSTTEPSPGPALRRMYAAGAVPTTLKALLYELVQCVSGIPWYPKGWAMKDHAETKPFPDAFIRPESWPPWESRF
jgi:nicotinamidase-related amidase